MLDQGKTPMRFRQILVLTASLLFGVLPAHAGEPLADSRVTLKNDTLYFNGAPSFSMQVPKGSKLTNRSDPKSQIAAISTPDNVTIEASIAQVGSTLPLENTGLRYFEVLRHVVGKNHRLVLHQPIRLPGNRAGYRTDIAWTLELPHQAPKVLHSTIISVIENGIWVFVAVHPPTRSKHYVDIVRSLRLAN